MNAHRMIGVARKTLRALKHDRRTAGFLVLMPLFMISIFGYTFGGDLKDVDVAVVNLDAGGPEGSVATRIIDELSSGETLRLDVMASSGATDAEEMVRQTDAWAAIVFPVNFTLDADIAVQSMLEGDIAMPSFMTVYVDATNPNIAQAVMTEIITAMQTVLVEKYGLIPPIAVHEQAVYGEDAEFIDFFAPGVMGLAAMMVTFMLSIISFVHERSTGTLDRLLTTPVTEGEIVGGYALALGAVALVQSVVILVTAVLLFDVAIEGNILLVLATILLLGIGSQGLGFLLSSIAKNEFQAVQFMPMIIFPSILLAGVFWPIEAVPELLRPVSYFIPLTYAVEGCRSVMIRGWDVGDIWFQLLVLAAFATAMLVLSAYSLKRRR